jgi:hypothetical protein
MKNSWDFQKLVEKNGNLLAVINLNNMIPIYNNYIEYLDYNNIDKYRAFNSDSEKMAYISLLQKELKLITSLKKTIQKNATKLYFHCIKLPNSRLARRSCNFKLLEAEMKHYKK